MDHSQEIIWIGDERILQAREGGKGDAEMEGYDSPSGTDRSKRPGPGKEEGLDQSEKDEEHIARS